MELQGLRISTISSIRYKAFYAPSVFMILTFYYGFSTCLVYRSYSPRYSPRGRRSPPRRRSVSPLRISRSYSRLPPPYCRARRDSPYGHG
ncbi:hypothetical protein Tco_1573063, partial [Tanacetum coccineum]